MYIVLNLKSKQRMLICSQIFSSKAIKLVIKTSTKKLIVASEPKCNLAYGHLPNANTSEKTSFQNRPSDIWNLQQTVDEVALFINAPFH